jgi:hypothetical protein
MDSAVCFIILPQASCLFLFLKRGTLRYYYTGYKTKGSGVKVFNFKAAVNLLSESLESWPLRFPGRPVLGFQNSKDIGLYTSPFLREIFTFLKKF